MAANIPERSTVEFRNTTKSHSSAFSRGQRSCHRGLIGLGTCLPKYAIFHTAPFLGHLRLLHREEATRDDIPLHKFRAPTRLPHRRRRQSVCLLCFSFPALYTRAHVSMCRVCRGLHANRTITSLDLAANGLDEYAGQELAHALLKNKT